MNIKQIVMVLISTLILTSCDVIYFPHYGEQVEAKYNFNYEIESPNTIKLSQVFDDKKITYIVFINKQEKPPEVTLPNNTNLLPVSQSGTYWILDGVYPILQVWKGSKSVMVNNKAFVMPESPAAVPDAAISDSTDQPPPKKKKKPVPKDPNVDQ
jgi:hypothetical protein